MVSSCHSLARRTVSRVSTRSEKNAYKLCRLRSLGIAAALKEVTTDNEHRTQHWVQLMAIANSAGSNDATIARLEKEVQLLKSTLQRSRSPRMRPRQRALPTVAADAGSSGAFWFRILCSAEKPGNA